MEAQLCAASERRITILCSAISVPVGRATAVLEDPGVSQITDLRDERKIIASKTCGVFPVIAVFVQPTDGHIVSRAVLVGMHEATAMMMKLLEQFSPK